MDFRRDGDGNIWLVEGSMNERTTLLPQKGNNTQNKRGYSVIILCGIAIVGAISLISSPREVLLSSLAFENSVSLPNHFSVFILVL